MMCDELRVALLEAMERLPKVRFAIDSVLEGAGFEPSVPLYGELGASGACDGPAPPRERVDENGQPIPWR
jgi:hypothetical protein